jgi:AcrR family transcriptional regulator
MLDAGMDLLVEWLHSSSAGGLLGNVRATDVARRVGKTTGSFFHWWPTQDAYRESLLEHLLSRERLREVNVEGSLQGINDAIEARGRLEIADVIRAGAVANLASIDGNQDFDVQLLLVAARAGDPRIARELQAFYQAILDAYVPIYEDFMAAFGLRIRAPYTVQNYAVILTALAEGLLMRRQVDPDAVPAAMEAPPGTPPPPPNRDAPWSLFAVAAYLLTTAMTESDPDASASPPTAEPLV